MCPTSQVPIFVDKRKNENNLKYSPSFEYQGKVTQENIVPMKYDNVKSVLRYKYVFYFGLDERIIRTFSFLKAVFRVIYNKCNF